MATHSGVDCFCVDGGETERDMYGVCKWCDGYERLRTCPACPDGEIDHACPVCAGHNLVPDQGSTGPKRHLEEGTHVLEVRSAGWTSNDNTREVYLNIVFKGPIEIALHERRQEEAIKEFISACQFLDSYVEDIESWDPTSVVGVFVEVTARERLAKNARTFMKYSFSPAESPVDVYAQRAQAAAVLAEIDEALGETIPEVVTPAGARFQAAREAAAGRLAPPCKHGVTGADGGSCARCFLDLMANKKDP